MSSQSMRPTIAFVWRPREISSSVVDVARRTGSQAIFDLNATDFEQAGLSLLQADARADAVELKVSPDALMSQGLEDLLRETELKRAWVELHPALLDGDVAPIFTKIAKLSEEYEIIPIIGDPDLIKRVVTDFPGVGKIALKGNEASGFVSTQTAFILYSTAREAIRSRGAGPDLYVWGGIATPEAAAAFLAAGAAGVVCESVHWLTDLVAADEQVRDKIAKLRPDHTELTGVNLEVPCRLFNKGNSKAVKELREFAGSLCGVEIRDEQRRFFANRTQAEAVHPLESKLDREQLIPMGVEAAFAASFVRRFGQRTEEAFDRFIAAVDQVLAQTPRAAKAFVDSPVAKALGTAYPFIQGAMSWITDVPEFARKVADAGALPTVALGMMSQEVLHEKLGRLASVMGNAPYAVNVITLSENPHREAQLAWIRETKPRFAVIAAGEPSHAAELIAAGVEAIYIAPNEELLKMALSAGIRYCICEGNEAGGHVGNHTTLTLAQVVLDMKDREPALFEGRTIILAGGICNRETAFMAAVLGADAVQMGTIYLTSREIVETRALTELYQRMILEAVPGSTTVTGEGTGLRVRSLKTNKIDSICSLERDFAAGAEDEASFRMKIEALSAGSLFIAARGLDKPDGVPLPVEECEQQGQFMSGACAGVLQKSFTLKEIHQDLAQGKLAEGVPFVGPVRESDAARPVGVEISEVAAAGSRRPAYGQSGQPERIAITGMSIVNSLGNSREDVWAASLAMKSGIIPVPGTRWNHELFYHPRPRMPEKTYCKVGAFQNVEVSRKDIGVPPQDFRTMTDATKISMWLAAQAIDESGILESDVRRERIGVLISQNSGEAAATLQDVIIRGSLTNIISAVKRVVQLSPEMEEAVAGEVTAGRIAIDDTTLLGRLNCSAGGFICNKYGFQGPSFSVSAACATALVALYSAYQMIRNGILDAAVVGGGEEFLTPMHFLEFSALGALAGLSGEDRLPSETSRPFDASRDGMVLGEGGGMIVIERESVARRRGAKILAFITSMGASNNNLGMVESSKITQEIALRASFRDAPYGPEAVDLVECHATSTKQGDVEEVQALQSLFDSGGRTTLTSFKSQIGHTLGASGVNSLIRGIMAMNAGIFPGTLNFQQPEPEMQLEGSGLVVHSQPVEWEARNRQPRRLQVNAFGFGGSNYVVQLEQATDSEDAVFVAPTEIKGEARESTSMPEPPEGLQLFQTQISGKSYRVAVVADSAADALALIKKSEPFTNGGGVAAKRLKAMARQGIHLGLADEAPPKLAFVFPGQGSHYAGMGHELYDTFPIIRQWMDRAAEVADFDLLSLLFHDREEDLQKTRWQQPALFTMEYAMVQYLTSLGIKPTALAGHSLGELTALCLAGVYSFEDGFRIVNMRAICMDKACTLNVDPGVMMAADAPMDVIEPMLSSWEDVYITNLNSPHQIVLGGNTENVKAMGAELKARGFRSTLLRVSMAFHSPIMRCIHDELEAFIADIPFQGPKIPVLSNTTTKPFPQDPVEIKRIVMAHLESPVHWMQNVESLWTDYGVRRFVEVGPREILSNLIKDINESAECIHTCLPSAETLIFRTALAQLFANGNVPLRGKPPLVSFPSSAKNAQPDKAAGQVVPVAAAVAGSVPASLEQTIQREINAFVLESFGRFLKPGLMAAIRRDHDPAFTEDKLDAVLGRLFPAVGALPPMPAVAPVLPLPMPQRAAVEVAPAVAAPAAPAKAEAAAPSDAENITESVIRIIMDATGYDRDEIEPDMDLREDLSIRSSRLPVIMDSVEAHFGIKIELEDFMDVRTIRDIADRISVLVARSKPKKAAEAKTGAEETAEAAEAEEDKQSLKRLVFREIPLEAGDSQPVEVDLLDSLAIFSAGSGTGLRAKVGTVFRRDYGVTPVHVSMFPDPSATEGAAFNFLTTEGRAEAVEDLAAMESLAGIVFVVDDLLEQRLDGMESASELLDGMFAILKTFLESGARKFALLINKCSDNEGKGRVLAEGILGMFLSAALEFSSVQFRTIRVDDQTDLRDAIRGALDRNRKPIQLIYREGEAFTMEGHVVPASYENGVSLQIHPGDVVIFSGGGYGISPYIARSMAPMGCKIVLLGRTTLDLDIDAQKLSALDAGGDAAIEQLVAERHPQLTGRQRAGEIERMKKKVDIALTIEQLRAAGTEATYVACDVTDAARTREVVAEIAARYGRIDGIVHAAGVLRDGFIKQMTPEDFRRVVDVKFLGAWNLLSAARHSGLKFFAGFSSAAAIQGNPGQANYAAGNRMMSALLSHARSTDESIRFKALMLPPIEGAGMAENEDIRAMMQRMNAAYVHVEEIAGLVARELFVASAQDVWVMFMRSLPDLSNVRLDTSDPPAETGKMSAAGMTFRNEDFPMIDAVSSIDLVRGEVTALRSFSQNKDLWIADHKPFKFLKYPLVSAIMAVETFMEACRIFYPHLRVRAVRDARFLDIIECPPDVTRESEISCRQLISNADGVQCEVQIVTREISPTGRVVDRSNVNYKALVVLNGDYPMPPEELPGFPVRAEELDSRPMGHAEALEWYQDRTDMHERYRVMEDLDGTSDGAVRGRMIYRQSPDFAPPLKTRYQYSPYLLEALMHLVNFYIAMRDPDEPRSMIPYSIGEMTFFRKVASGEEITLEARMMNRDDEGITWIARALDETGRIVMIARELRMRWFGK
jgi:malonyl CoA-acyl carrier protein transacylase